MKAPLFSPLFPFPAGFLTLALLANAPTAHAQAPAWQAALSITPTPAAAARGTYAIVQATAADAAGSVYVAGTFGGSIPLGSTTLSAPSGGGLFVAKWSPATGQFVWARQAAGGVADIRALAVSAAGVYVAGSYYGTLTLDGAVLTNSTGGTAGNNSTTDAFVAKLTDAGSTASFTWARSSGGPGSEFVQALAVSGGSVYAAGFFSGASATFGTTTFTNSNPSPAPALADSYDSFVAKLTDAGSAAGFTWAQQLGGPLGDRAEGVAVAGSSVYVTGSFSGTATVAGSVLVSAGGTDGYVARFTDQGASAGAGWAQRLGGPGNDALAAAAATSGAVYVAGSFESTATLGTATLTVRGATDAVVARLGEASGALSWAQPAGGTYNDAATALAVRGASVYATGNFNRLSPSIPGTTATFGNLTVAGVGGADVFVARLADAGGSSSVAWVQTAGGLENDYGLGVALSGSGVYVGGYTFGAGTTFGSFTVPNTAYNYDSAAGLLGSLTDQVLPSRATTALPGVALFPNPARATATVRVPVGGAGPATLTLLDALGRVVRTAAAPAGQNYPLDLMGLAPGVYALRVRVGEGAATQRLVVE